MYITKIGVIQMANTKKPENERQTRFMIPIYPDTLKILRAKKLASNMTWDDFIFSLLKKNNVGK